jgi:hypothetical protein
VLLAALGFIFADNRPNRPAEFFEEEFFSHAHSDIIPRIKADNIIFFIVNMSSPYCHLYLKII